MEHHVLTSNHLKKTYKTKTDVILLAHSLIGTIRGKSANGLLIHNELFNVVAIVDRNAAGKLTSEECQGVEVNKPIYPDMQIAVYMQKAKAVILLTDPSPYLHTDIKTAIKNKLDIINTSFTFIKNIPSIKSLANLYKIN